MLNVSRETLSTVGPVVEASSLLITAPRGIAPMVRDNLSTVWVGDPTGPTIVDAVDCGRSPKPQHPVRR